MSKLNINQREGLCSTCSQQNNCMYLQKRSTAIWFCEHFEAVSDESTSLGNNTKSSIPVDQAETEKVSGLCFNCETRTGCIQSNKPGGVWFCNDYS